MIFSGGSVVDCIFQRWLHPPTPNMYSFIERWDLCSLISESRQGLWQLQPIDNSANIIMWLPRLGYKEDTAPVPWEPRLGTMKELKLAQVQGPQRGAEVAQLTSSIHHHHCEWARFEMALAPALESDTSKTVKQNQVSLLYPVQSWFTESKSIIRDCFMSVSYHKTLLPKPHKR